MKKRNIIIGVIFLFIAGSLSLISCKKESSTTTTTSLTGQQTEQVQNSDAQDAIADKTEEDVDNNLDELQNNNYQTSGKKSAFASLTDSLVITVDHPDTITFPKVVTLNYYNYQDSSTNEPITKNGEIIVTINRPDANHPLQITRKIQFINFTVITDSTTVTINGTRQVDRSKATVTFSGLEDLQEAKISVTDSITTPVPLRYAIATTGSTDSLIFTRNVNRVRTAIAYYKNINFDADKERVYNLLHLRFKHQPSLDELTYTGTVTGLNERDSAYTKTITSTLEISVYKGSLVITAGAMTYVAGSSSYDITFQEDPAHPHFTLVTVTNNQTGKTKSFDRRFGRRFYKWW
jgi:hypothetical protein